MRPRPFPRDAKDVLVEILADSGLGRLGCDDPHVRDGEGSELTGEIDLAQSCQAFAKVLLRDQSFQRLVRNFADVEVQHRPKQFLLDAK
jgi:hypothetical protein